MKCHGAYLVILSFLLMGCGDDESPLPVSGFLNPETDTGEEGGGEEATQDDLDRGPTSGTKDAGAGESEGGGASSDVGEFDSDTEDTSVDQPDTNTEPDGEEAEDIAEQDVTVEEGGEGGGTDGGSTWLPSTCEDSETCPGLQVCLDGVCDEPPICLTDQDCLNDRVCSHGVCADTPFGCQVDAECFGGYCNTFNGKCSNEFPCIDQSGCATGICAGTSCVECVADTDLSLIHI